MTQIRITPDRVIGHVHPRLYGSFVEHLGRCVYGGIWEEGSPLSDEIGYRGDTLAAVRELGVTCLRYPGGNFVSNYHWRDGVGPRDQRPARRELAWLGIETNRFGTDEFLAYCARVPCEPYLCVNLGTGTPEEAADWLEYCNGRQPTALVQQRVRNGHAEPYGVRLWGLGNEMYGHWQIGQRSAQDYALVARETAKAMRLVDPEIELVAVGHEDGPYWNTAVLSACAHLIDHIALHVYIGSDDTAEALAQPLLLEHLARRHAALIALVLDDLGLQRRIGIALDEWNVWYRTVPGRATQEPELLDETAPQEIRLEERYNLRDALAVACCLNAMIRCADIVTLANLAQLVNAIAPLRTSRTGLLRQTIFYPFALYARLMRGMAVASDVTVDAYTARVRSLNTKAADVTVPYLDSAATVDENTGTVTCGVVNRSADAPIDAAVRLVDGRIGGEVRVWTLTGESLDAENSFDRPDAVVPSEEVIGAEQLGDYRFPPRSLTLLQWRLS